MSKELKICPKCKAEFYCHANDKESRCWCMDLPHEIAVPSEYKECLCKQCLEELIELNRNKKG